MKWFKLLFLSGLLCAVFSQQWQREFGGIAQERGYSVQQVPDGGYIAAGFTYSFGAGAEDIYLVRTDPYGETLWTRYYGGTGTDEGQCVCLTQDNGFVIAGATSSFGTHDWQFYLIRTNAAGDTLWTRTYPGLNGAMCNSVSLTPDGGYILAGIEWTGSSTGARLVKTNSSGDTVWTHTYVLADGADARCVEPVAGGGFIVTGDVFSGTNDILLIRTGASGDTLWTHTYGGGGYEYGYQVRQTPDSGFIVAGSTDSYGAGGSDVYLIRTDANGDTLWTRTYGGPGDDVGRSVDLTSDSGYVIAGWVIGSGVCLIRTNAHGDTLWTRSYGGGDVMLGYDVHQTADSGFILTGEVRANLGLVKTDADGNVVIRETPDVLRSTASDGPTIVRGMLKMPLASGVKHSASSVLFDITGRKVLDLHPGANDIKHIAPGVYFIRFDTETITKKLIITK
jgi:hypothetical protein